MSVTTALIRGVSRRSALAMAAGSVVGSQISPTVARDMGRQVSPKAPFIRVVAVDAIGSSSSPSLTVSGALGWVSSGVGPADLVVVRAGEDEIGNREIELAQHWAERNSCYVALAGHENVLLGPDNRLEVPKIVSGLHVFSAEIGKIAMHSLEANDITQLVGDELEVDMLVSRAVTDVPRNNVYVIGLSSTNGELIAGPIIYGPGGRVMTRASAGRAQGVTALLNVASLRPTQLPKQNLGAFLDEDLGEAIC